MQKYRFLSPFAWFYQLGRYVFRGLNRKGAIQRLKEEYNSAMKRNAMLDALEVTQSNKGLVVYQDGKYIKKLI